MAWLEGWRGLRRGALDWNLLRDRGGADQDLWGEWPSLQREHDKLTAPDLYRKQRHVGSRRTFPGWPTRIDAGKLF